MGSIRLPQACCFALALFALAACSPTSAPPSPPGNLRTTPAAGDMVAQVRAAGNSVDALDVKPLRDPQVEDLRMRASRLEAVGDYAGATQAIVQALALTPNDPELLQKPVVPARTETRFAVPTQLDHHSFHPYGARRRGRRRRGRNEGRRMHGRAAGADVIDKVAIPSDAIGTEAIDAT